ncbi:DUF350 domain-containing protein [Nocardia sp. alder85J]|uniref:DUF350 domain-containing protein n=1 Tax=Nocardia sp. alder85J TaxID=2862949 RepID=UPI001CD5110D|nr:DUF350 domain-containing protein [Nocardia sp. alder85J]MCX4094040.1 DUF350 domain-containing protein [Nocardia sp. alder85J]
MATIALEPGYWGNLGHGVGAIAAYAAVGLVLMLVGFAALDITTPGLLRKLVGSGRPNANIIAAAGLLATAIIVVFAIYSSGGHLSEGLISAAIFGLVGIAAQVISARVMERLIGINIGDLLHATVFVTESLVVAAAHLGIALVIGVAIV